MQPVATMCKKYLYFMPSSFVSAWRNTIFMRFSVVGCTSLLWTLMCWHLLSTETVTGMELTRVWITDLRPEIKCHPSSSCSVKKQFQIVDLSIMLTKASKGVIYWLINYKCHLWWPMCHDVSECSARHSEADNQLWPGDQARCKCHESTVSRCKFANVEYL